MTIIRDYFQQAFKIQTQLETNVFKDLAAKKMRLNPSSELFAALCDCLLVEDTDGEFISIKKLQLLTDLYQLIPLRTGDHRN